MRWGRRTGVKGCLAASRIGAKGGRVVVAVGEEDDAELEVGEVSRRRDGGGRGSGGWKRSCCESGMHVWKIFRAWNSLKMFTVRDWVGGTTGTSRPRPSVLGSGGRKMRN